MEKEYIQAVMNKNLTEHTFPEKLKSIRISKNLTQKQLAEAAGITAATLSAYENGIKVPVLTTAAEIARKCGVTLDWLCGIDTIRKDQEDITYSDIIRALLRLSDLIPIKISAYNENEGTLLDTVEMVGKIDIKNLVIIHFLEEWAKVKDLYDSGVIDKNIYDPWVAQQLIDYDCSLCDIPFKLE